MRAIHIMGYGHQDMDTSVMYMYDTQSAGGYYRTSVSISTKAVQRTATYAYIAHRDTSLNFRIFVAVQLTIISKYIRNISIYYIPSNYFEIKIVKHNLTSGFCFNSNTLTLSQKGCFMPSAHRLSVLIFQPIFK